MKNFIKAMSRYMLLTALPLGVLIVLIKYYGVDIPCRDQWLIIPNMIDKYYSGTLTFSDIIAQHGEHRIAVGKLIMLMNILLTNWNIYVEFAVNVLFAVGSSIVVYYAVNKLDIDLRKKAVIYFTSACLIFSFSQEVNWLWGFQMQIFMSVFFVLSALVLLAYGGLLAVIGAAFLAVLGTFSFANGMLVWPAGFVFLAASIFFNKDKSSYSKIVIWSVLGLITICAYFVNFKISGLQSPASEKIKLLLSRPYMFITLFTVYLGNPVANFRQSAALFSGCIGFVLYVYSLIKITRLKLWEKNKLFWLSVSLYVILSALVTSFGRTKSISTTMSLRYLPISIFFWVSVMCLFFSAEDTSNHRVPMKIYILFAALIISHSVSEETLVTARERYDSRTVFKQQVLDGQYDNEWFLKYIGGRQATRFFKVLKNYNIRHFQNAPDVEFNDFKPLKLNPEDVALTPGTSFELSDELGYSFYFGKDKNFLSTVGWWKMDGLSFEDRYDAKAYIVLYNDKEAFEARIYRPDGTRRFGDKPKEKYDFAKATKYKDAYENYKRNFFIANQLYYGNLPSGTYKTALKVIVRGSTYYFPFDGTLSPE